MPKIVMAVPELEQSVTRPIVLDITRQLFAMTGIPPTTSIFYPGDNGRAKQPNSGITPDSDINNAPFTNKITIEVEEDYQIDHILTSAIYRPENLFIFRDDRIETNIKPIYSATDVTLSFHFRAIDKASCMRWRDDIKTRVSMSRDVINHDLSYYYLIPPEFLVILKELHRMRENVNGYGEDYDTYFKANSTQRASYITNLIGTQGQWAISETQMRVIGVFDFEGVPERGSTEDEGGTWSIGFSYKFKYDKPSACTMSYPLVIHNQVVAQNYRPDAPVDTPDQHVRSYSLSAENFYAFEKKTQLLGTPQGVAIPSFDEFIPASTPVNTMRVFTAMTTLDPAAPSLLMSLTNLGVNQVIDPDILAFITGEIAYLTRARQSAFAISLYRNIDLLEPNAVKVMPNLDVVSNIELSTRDYHHVRLSLATDLSQLPIAARDRMRMHGKACQLILMALDPSLQSRGFIPILVNNTYVTRADLQRAIDEINRVVINQGDHQVRQFNYTEFYFLQAFRRDDLAT
jgi:hypothetical protein